MANTKILKVDAEPTIFNKEMVIGALMPGIGLPIGAIVGGIMGNSRMQREKLQGRIVSDEPSGWNKDAILGAELGGIGGVIAGIAAAATLAIMFTSMAPLAGLVMWGGYLTGMGAGAYIGSSQGIASERKDYEKAKHQEAERGISQAISQSQERGQGLEQQPSRNHAAQIETERSAMATNQQQR